MRTRWSRSRPTTAALTLALFALTACSLAGSDRDARLTRSSPWPGCGEVRPLVSVDADTSVRVTNVSGAPCRFSSRYPVRMAVWLSGPEPPVATGVLEFHATYVQPYDAVASNGCPGTTKTGADSVVVQIEGVAHLVAMPARRAYEIKVCIMFRAGPPRVER